MDDLVDEASNVLRAPWTAIFEYFLVLPHMADPTAVCTVSLVSFWMSFITRSLTLVRHSAIFSSNLDDERSDDEEDHAEPAPKGKCE
jgi:hypothetical protein